MPNRLPTAPILTMLLVGVALGGSVGGCETPTLPLPPPTALVSAPDAGGMVTVEVNGAEPAAFVMCLNASRGEGIIMTADANGSTTIRIAASTGELLQVWQRIQTDSSEINELIVPGGGGTGDAGP